jgi:hypothetical protein
VQHLPVSWGTLYELTKLPEDKLEIALSEGWVRPETQRGDVKNIRERLGVESEPRLAPCRQGLSPKLASSYSGFPFRIITPAPL